MQYNKNIRLAIPNLLMMPFRLLIPLEMYMLMMWLSTIRLTTLQGNEGDTNNALVIMFDQMWRHVT